MYDIDIERCLTSAVIEKVEESKAKGEIWDGMFTRQQLENATLCMSKGAELRGLDEEWFSPFSRGAAQNNLTFHGGKEDDITVVVAQIRLKVNNEIPEDAHPIETSYFPHYHHFDDENDHDHDHDHDHEMHDEL